VSKLNVEELREVLVNKLSGKGFRIRESHRVKGFSGVIHEFDILVEEDDKRCAINLCRNEVTIELIKAIALYIDTKIPQIMVCKEYKKDLDKMVRGSNIKVSIVPAENLDMVIEKIVEYLSSALNRAKIFPSNV